MRRARSLSQSGSRSKRGRDAATSKRRLRNLGSVKIVNSRGMKSNYTCIPRWQLTRCRHSPLLPGGRTEYGASQAHRGSFRKTSLSRPHVKAQESLLSSRSVERGAPARIGLNTRCLCGRGAALSKRLNSPNRFSTDPCDYEWNSCRGIWRRVLSAFFHDPSAHMPSARCRSPLYSRVPGRRAELAIGESPSAARACSVYLVDC